jgi:Tfp pilus assembly PilM family ATPase
LSRFLGIDWDLGPDGHAPLLRIVEGSIKNRRVTILNALALPETILPNPAEAEEAGRRLKTHLAEAKISPAPVLYVLGRNRVVFRDVRYPDVPEGEVATLIHYQVSSDLPFPPEEAVLDYAICPCPGPSGEQRANVFVMRKDLLQAIRALCKTAGLKLDAVSLRPYALLANWQAQAGTPADDGAARAVFVVTDGGGELSVAKGTDLLFSRLILPVESAGVVRGSWQSYLPELRRTLAACASQFPMVPIKSLYLAGKLSSFEESLLADGLGLEVSSFDPLDAKGSAAHPGAVASSLGIIQAKAAAKRLKVDFLAPKEPRPPVNVKRRYIAVAASIAVLIVTGIGAAYGMAVADRNSQISDLNSEIATQQEQIKSYGDTEERLGSLTSWDKDSIVVLDELYDLICRFPDLPYITISKFQWEQAQKSGMSQALAAPVPAAQATNTGFDFGKAGGASSAAAAPVAKPAVKAPPKPIGTITMDVTSTQVYALERFRQALEQARHWKVDWEPNGENPSKVQVNLKVFHYAPDEYHLALGQPFYTTIGERSQRPSGPPRGGSNRPLDRPARSGPPGDRPPPRSPPPDAESESGTPAAGNKAKGPNRGPRRIDRKRDVRKGGGE